jgi:hypothetical protein
LDVDRLTLIAAVHAQRMGRAKGIEASTNDWLMVGLAQRHHVRLLHDDPILAVIGESVGFPSVGLSRS